MKKKKNIYTRSNLIGASILFIGAAYIVSNVITKKLQAYPLVSTTAPELGESFLEGKTLYDANCAQCHGAGLGGVSGLGPPFVHNYYNSGHHSDVAFYRAIELGVTAHHWKFGNMPAQAHINQAQATQIIAYIREVQKANGIE